MPGVSGAGWSLIRVVSRMKPFSPPLAIALSFVFAIPSSHSSAQSIINTAQAWGATSNGLRMAISPVTPGAVPPQRAEFYVAFQNVGDKDIILNLGSMLANGKVHFPEAVHLILTDAQGKTRELQFSDKRYPGVLGRVDDFIVALRSGATYILRLSLEQYWCPSTKEFDLRLIEGRYRIAARFEGKGANSVNLDMQGIALMNFWKGTLQSDWLDFEVSEQPAADDRDG
jgi:hypothetical protein